jgi:hypothetical protein
LECFRFIGHDQRGTAEMARSIFIPPPLRPFAGMVGVQITSRVIENRPNRAGGEPAGGDAEVVAIEGADPRRPRSR